MYHKKFLNGKLKVVVSLCNTQWTMHQGLSILEKAITKCLTLETDFPANFHLIHEFFLCEALLTSQKLENEEANLQISV